MAPNARQVDLVLDSGAFSCWKRQEELKLDEYIEFCHLHKAYIWEQVNLDTIPGHFGKVPSPAEVEESAAKSHKNALLMRAAGLEPMPVYHMGERRYWLDKIIGDGFKYVGISPANDRTTKQKVEWLDEIFGHICGSKGFPQVKTHGFGVTALPILFRYPWYCMTDEHEILTTSGWKGRGQIKVGEMILSFNDGKAEWKPVLEVPTFEVNDAPIVYFNSRTFSAEVTENHRWRVQNYYTKQWQWKTTLELNSAHRIPRRADYAGNPEQRYSDQFVELAAWWWTDGCINKRPNYKSDSVSIYQSVRANPEKVARIREVLKVSGEAHCESFNEQDGCINFELYGSVRDQLLEVLPDKLLHMPFLLALTKEQLDLFVRVSVLGDGWKGKLVRSPDSFCLGQAQKNRSNLELFRIACLLAGHATSLQGDESAQPTVVSSSVDFIDPTQAKKETWAFTGKIWCVRVENGAYFTRCKNKVYVTGNTADSMTWLVFAAYGGLIIPQSNEKGYCYNLPPYMVKLSSKASDRIYESGTHYATMGPGTQKYIRDYVETQGFDFSKMADDYVYRMRFNARFFKLLEAAHTVKPFFQRKIGLFGSKDTSPHGFTENQFGRFKVIFTQNTSKENGKVLQDEGIRHRLLSYYIFKNSKRQAFDVEEYVRTGLVAKGSVAEDAAPEATPIAGER
jgi:hypothetical protein